MFFLFFLAAVIAAAVVLVRYALGQSAKRTGELGELARSINFAFETGPFQPGSGPFAGAGSFPMFNEGFDRKITNVLHGRVDDAEVQVFDYHYITESVDREITRSGNHNETTTQAHHSFTAALFSSSGTTHFPNLQLYPETIFSKMGAVFGGQDIDLPQFPEFSKRFVLKSTDENAVRALIDQPTAAFFEANAGVSVHAAGPYLLFFRANKKVPPAEARQFLDTAVYAYRTLGAAAARARP